MSNSRRVVILLVGYRNEQGETVDVSDLKVDKDITLYPIYKINTYTVKFFDADNKCYFFTRS